MEDYKTQRVALFRQAREAFLESVSSRVTFLVPQVKVFKQGRYVVFGVKKDDQDKVDYDQLRTLLTKELGFKSDTPFIQFIGSSALYSSAGTAYAAQYVEKQLCTESIVLYGYTGAKNKAGDAPQRDINQLISDWADQESDAHERSGRVIANIVDEHTLTAINEWGSTIPQNVNHFYMVYSDTPKPSVRFGDDVISSDSITKNCAYALEGGIQTLRQMIYMLCRGIPVTGLVNLRDLRDPNDSINFDPVTKRPYLSAVHFFNYMKSQLEKVNTEIDAEVLQAFADTYLDTYALYNKNKGDASTKQELWDDAWHQFKTEGWKHLAQFTCEICHVPEHSESSAIRAMIERQERKYGNSSLKSVKTENSVKFLL